MNKPGIRLLLIEDSVTDALLLEKILNQDALNSFTVTLTECLESGLETLKKQTFDLVLLDLGLPDSQGLATFEKLHEEYPDIPVVVLSGLRDDRLALEAIQAGAQDYLVKGPTSWEIASRAIRYAIERTRAEQQLRASEERYRDLVENIQDLICTHDLQGNLLFVNQTPARLLGYTPEELIGMNLRDLLAPDVRDQFDAYLSSIQKDGSASGFMQVLTKDGQTLLWEYRNTLRTAGVNTPIVRGVARDVTVRRQAERAIIERERQMAALVTSLDDIVFEFDEQGTYLNVWAADENKLTQPKSQMLGRQMNDVLDEEIAHSLTDAVRRAVVEGRTGTIEYPLQVIGGQRWFMARVNPILAQNSPRRTASMLVRDITDRKQAEESLRESEERFRSLIEQSSEGITLIGEDGKIWEWNLAMEQITGIPRTQATGLYVWDVQFQLLPYERRTSNSVDRIKSMFLEILRTGKLARPENRVEVEMQTANGERKIITQTIFTIKTANGYRIGSIALDITGRKQTEKMLSESEKRYRTTLTNMMEGCQIIDYDWRYVYINDSGAKQGRSTPEKLLMHTMMEMYPGIETTDLFKVLRRCMEARVPERLENEFRFVDGTNAWFELSIQPVPEGLFILSIDITGRKQAEAALRDSEEKYRLLVEKASIGIVIAQDQKLKYINPRATELVGYSSEELLSIDFAECIHPDDRDETLGYYLKFMQGEETPANHIFRILDKTGGTKWVDSNAVLVNWDGQVASLNFLMEITKRKQAEQALRVHLAELETLYESGLILSQITNPTSIAQKLITLMAEKLAWHHVTIRRYHPEDGSLELLAFSHPEKASDEHNTKIENRFQSMITKVGEGLSGWVVQHGVPVRSGNLSEDSRYLAVVPGLHSGLYVPMKIGEQIMGVISIESELPEAFTEADERMISTLAAQAAVTLDNIQLFEDLQKSNDRLGKAYDDTIEGWSNALDLRDKETEGHTQRVTTLTEELAREMGIPESEMIHIRRGALLHDIGKMSVPDRILLKPDKLTEDEWVIMRQHPVHAYNLLFRIEFLRPALNIPHYHHEKWDGSGYPDGLKGEEIPLEARIFAIIDVYDALTSDRPYRPAWSKKKAIEHIREQAGRYFDAQIVPVFVRLIEGK